jgi:protein TonB
MNKLTSVFVFVFALAASLTALVFAPATYAKEFHELGCGDGYGPKTSQPPVYPRRAEARGIEGYIVMGFTIGADGTVKDVQVVDQQPSNTFVRSATRAVQSLEFPPCVVDGQVVEQAAVSIKYDFQLQR